MKTIIVSILCLSLLGCATTGNLSNGDPQKKGEKETLWTWLFPEGPLKGLEDAWMW